MTPTSPHLRIAECPVCRGRRFAPAFANHKTPLEACTTCGLLLQNPQPSDETLREIYDAGYFIGSGNEPDLADQFKRAKRATARLQLDEIAAYLREIGGDPPGQRLIEIGCGHGNMLIEARARGFDVQGVEFSADAAAVANASLGGRVQVGSIESADLPADHFDVCIAADVIEHVREPRLFLDRARGLLKPGGVIFIATPSLDSWSSKVLGRHWMEYKPEHLYYFNRETLARLVNDVGFARTRTSAGRKVLTPGYAIAHFRKFPIPVISPVLAGLEKVLPSSLQRSQWTLTASGINLLATRAR